MRFSAISVWVSKETPYECVVMEKLLLLNVKKSDFFARFLSLWYDRVDLKTRKHIRRLIE